MSTDLKTLLANAQAEVSSCSVEDAERKLGNPDYIFVDVRESAELETDGRIPGAVHIPRGMLEFTMDKSTPYFNPIFGSGKNIVFFCKSGGRSLLAAQRAKEMGIPNVENMAGGIVAWNKMKIAAPQS